MLSHQFAGANAPRVTEARGRWLNHPLTGAGIRMASDMQGNPEKDSVSPSRLAALNSGEAGTVREVAIQDANGPKVWSHQSGVVPARVNELLDHPDRQDWYGIATVAKGGEVTLHDGNHRTTAALLRNEMFQPLETY
jgi:hypothetical protein